MPTLERRAPCAAPCCPPSALASWPRSSRSSRSSSVARKEQPKLAILDLGLPGGDGFLVMDRLRAFGDLETLPIVVVTARTTAEARERAEGACVAAFFEKPFDADELLAKVREILG